jgi:putative membrane protein
MMWWDTGHWFWGVVMMVAFWGVLAFLVYHALRGRSGLERPSARELLDERLAKGELSEQEYERKRSAIEGRSTVDQ